MSNTPKVPLLGQLYTQMARIRAFENAAEILSQGGVSAYNKTADGSAKVRGPLHLSTGQEAVAVGVCAHLRASDYLTSTHRGHGHTLAKGADLGRMMGELYGKSNGFNGGKGGSMHIASLDHGMLGANGIVGAGIPISTGAALGFWVTGRPNVALCFFGDGAANEGAFHEGINFAAGLKLPVVFICENNGYAQFQSVQQDTPIPDIATRSISYGIPGVIVEGSDILAMYGAVRTAVDRARAGEGPTLIEAKTYRFEGHFLGDPEPYRTREEVAHARATRDPLKVFSAQLQELGVATTDDLARIDRLVRDEVERSVEFGEASPEPSEDILLTDIYTGADSHGRTI